MRDTAQQIVDLMRLDLRIEAQAVDTGVRLRCEGEDLDVLSRDDGEIGGALRFVLNRMGRRAWPDAGRVQLQADGGGAVDERDEDVLEMVREVVQQVRNTGEPKRLHPMNAYERRLVHIEVRATPGVASRSEGDGDLKRVTIYPEPDDDAPENAEPDDDAPDRAMPDEAGTENAAPDEDASDRATSDEAEPESAAPGEDASADQVDGADRVDGAGGADRADEPRDRA